MSTETLLHYNTPAEDFTGALPVGNGRIGGMICGTAAEELIRLNEDSLWSGKDSTDKELRGELSVVRELLLDGRTAEAEKAAFSALRGDTPDVRRFMPPIDLRISMKTEGKPKNYYRDLELTDAVSHVSYTVNDVRFERSVFCSAPDEVMVIQITTDTPGSISLECLIEGCESSSCEDSLLLCTGSFEGISYAVCTGASAEGGDIHTEEGRITVSGADSVMIVLSFRTSARTESYAESAEVDAEMALQCSYDELYYRHADGYRELFERTELCLNDNSEHPDISSITTEDRIERLKGDVIDNTECRRLIHDNKLIELLFNYGRYLMISGSRPGTQPLSLQGIWSEQMQPGSGYTINISTEMNYWCAESCNLSECHLPLFDYLEKTAEKGMKTAKELYGTENGIAFLNNTDICGDAAQDMLLSGILWPAGGAWLALHIFEHYEYTLDKDFLEEHYHLLRGAAEFFTEFLTENTRGRLVTCPSVSLVNTDITPDGAKGCLGTGSSMDSQILTVLFTDVIKASEILDTDHEFADRLRSLLPKLPQPEAGKYGQIREWAVAYDETEISPCHVSQLFALYPADLITPAGTPELADAARTTLVRRQIHSGDHTGWSSAWITNMWARLGDGRMVYEYIKRILAHSITPNLLGKRPPLQIDTVFGTTAAIAESLLRSCGGEIFLLPALPDEWQEGSVRGLRAKGGFGADIIWKEGKLVSAVITSANGGECRLRTGCVVSISCDGETVGSRIEDGVIIFATKPGCAYTVKA